MSRRLQPQPSVARRVLALSARRALAAPGSLALAACLVLAACTASGVSKPHLLPIGPASVAVNETLHLPLVVSNPSGLALDYRFTGPDLPGLDEVTSLSGTPSGGEFRWTPLASHVGSHELVFEIRSSAGTDSQSVVITVTPPQSAAPVFLHPGAGGTYDLSRDPCVRFDVEVRDDDSANVDIRFRGLGGPDGSQLTDQGPKRAAFEWCPTADQVESSERWTIPLEADDGDHEPTPHDYLVVLRTQARESCSGQPPVIDIVSPAPGARVPSATGYPVVVTVTDDVGVREPPLLYYSSTLPDDPGQPDVTGFDQATFRQDGSQWEATVPSLGLQPGEEQAVYYLVSATDNDDPTGTVCDHRTDTPLVEFTAVGEEAGSLAARCDVCTGSIQCASGVCASGAGGRCLEPCDPAGAACAAGSCAARNTIEGATVNACGDAASVCEGGGGTCSDDAFEENDTRASAADPGGSVVHATLCAGDPDFYRFGVAAQNNLTVTLNGFDDSAADLDLELLDAGGSRLGISAGVGPSEQVSYCAAADATVYAHVYSVVASDQSDYTLSIDETPGTCCANDANEPDDTPEQATRIGADGNFDGTICPGDHDYYDFEIDSPAHLSALLVFDGQQADLDLVLYGPDGALLRGSYGTGDQESLEVDLAAPGVYALRVEVYGEGSADYLGQIELSAIAGCQTTLDCPIGTSCYDGVCLDDTCFSDDDCPDGSFCPIPGPVPSVGHCAAVCEVNADCRAAGSVVEACKRFLEGHGCGVRGSALNGAACADYTDCGGQRACLDWAGGYCARAGCASSSECETDSLCAVVGGDPVCVKRCGTGQPACREAAGYTCSTVTDIDGVTQASACVPP